MATTTPNLGLTVWNSDNDIFDYTVLTRNFQAIDTKFGAASNATQFIDTLSSLPAGAQTDGKLIYLSAANGGFTKNTIVQYRTTPADGWYHVATPELVRSLPVQGNYSGRVIAFNGAATDGSGYVEGDVLIYASGGWAKVNRGVGTYASASAAKTANSTSGNLAVLTTNDNTSTTGGPFGAYSLLVYNASSGNYQLANSVPPGTIQMYAGLADGTGQGPYGWLLCDGSTKNKADYPNLDAVLAAASYPYGSATLTFTLPDLRGRMPVGYYSGGTTDVNALNKNEGVAAASRRVKHGHTDNITFGAKMEYKSTIQDSGGNPYYMWPYSTSGFWDDTPVGGGNGSPQGYVRRQGTVGVNQLDTAAYITLNFIIKV